MKVKNIMLGGAVQLRKKQLERVLPVKEVLNDMKKVTPGPPLASVLSRV